MIRFTYYNHNCNMIIFTIRYNMTWYNLLITIPITIWLIYKHLDFEILSYDIVLILYLRRIVKILIFDMDLIWYIQYEHNTMGSNLIGFTIISTKSRSHTHTHTLLDIRLNELKGFTLHTSSWHLNLHFSLYL